MYVFPGKPLNVLIQFKVGDNPVSPSLAAYRVVDTDGVVVPTTALTIGTGETQIWVTIPDTVHTLTTGERYRQHRLEVSFTANGMAFEENVIYFVVPDLFLDFSARNVRTLVGMSEAEFDESDVDFYRAYIDLAAGEIGDLFVEALNSTDTEMRVAARQLMFWYTLKMMIPSLRLRALKSIESETSKMTRMATTTTFESLDAMVNERYDLYYALINTTASNTPPTFFILDNPTDPITGVTP